MFRQSPKETMKRVLRSRLGQPQSRRTPQKPFCSIRKVLVVLLVFGVELFFAICHSYLQEFKFASNTYL